jgi:diketogulonate reductase-like aldo/keto reductase
MVRIKRNKNRRGEGFLSQMTLPMHFCVVMQFLAIVACVGFYMMLDSHENKLFGSSLTSSTLLGVAAHSAPALIATGKPYLLYGTAWKKDDTARLVSEAVKSGFRFIDTACQPKHYNEPGVGNGWTAAAQELGLSRQDFFLQTKYTAPGGQDPKTIPYDPHSSLEEQMQTSLQTSLKNLHTSYLDSWLLHSPLDTVEDTIRAWRIMEDAVDQGTVRQLGISNCYDYHVFDTLYQAARIKPKVLQNRFHAETDFDTRLRAFCNEHDIHYQSFWTLTANRHALATPEAKAMALQKGLTPQTYLYAFLMTLGNGYVTPLSGTTTPIHMAQDVAVMERIQGGEVLFTETELHAFAKLLGMPAL